MSIRLRAYSVVLGSCIAMPVTNLLAQELPFGEGWRFVAWVGMCFSTIAVLDRFARCPHCGARLLGPGFKADPSKFAYIRCQSCRRRFDGREGPDPEMSNEALAQGDPMLLKVYRDTSVEMDRLIRSSTDPVARDALLADLQREAQQCEVELRRMQAAGNGEREIVEFLSHNLKRIRQEIAELGREKQRKQAGRR